MGLLSKIKICARKFIDSFYCKNLPSKRNLGAIDADNWFVLTNNLQNAIVYSGGVGKDINFELALVKEYNCTILLFDPSPTGMATIRSLDLPKNIKFFPVGLAGSDNKFSFASPINPLEGSYAVGSEGDIEFECRSVSAMAKEFNHPTIELLKIDIEGFEYGVIDDLLDNHLNVRQIVVEFHDFYENIERSKTVDCLAKLKSHGYDLFHKRGHDYSFVKNYK